jgi:hypothetical protein
MQEKYGFVYIWLDRKQKRYYIGMHWGTENDGYICSSPWMRQAHKHRPKDFKRRILERVYINRKELYEREKYWLSLVKDEELKIRYYNLSKNVNDTWLDESNLLSRKEKISIRTKEAMQRPEIREKYIEGLKTRDTKSSNIETKIKRRNTMLENNRNKGKITVKDSDGNIFHTTHDDPKWISGELIAASKGIKRAPLTEEHKQKIKNAGAFSLINNTKIKCVYCDFWGNKGNVYRYHNEKCRLKNADI